jgi:hypothetical protein
MIFPSRASAPTPEALKGTMVASEVFGFSVIYELLSTARAHATDTLMRSDAQDGTPPFGWRKITGDAVDSDA